MTDSRYRWWIVVYSLLIQALSTGVVVYCFAIFAVQWLAAFSASRAEVMVGIAAMQIAFGAYSPLAGAAIDRYRSRNVVLLGCVALVTGLLLLSQATALWQVIVIYATLFPLSMCLMGTLISQSLVTRWFTDKRGLAIGLSAMGTNVGGITLPLLLSWALLSVSWQQAVLILAGIAVVLVVPATLVVLRRDPPAPGNLAPADLEPALTTTQILRTKRFWLPVMGMLPLNIAFGAVQFNLGAYATDLGFSAMIGQLIAISSVCMIAGKLFFGSLADRLDHIHLFWTAAACMLVSMLALQNAPALPQLIVGVICLGLAGGGILPLTAIILGARFATASFGRVMGLSVLAVSLASLGPLFAGWVYDTTGNYDLAFQVFIALMLPGMIAMFWLPKPQATHATSD